MVNKIDIKKCIGSSTDGAANMQGTYNGFQAWLSQQTGADILYVWCYAHVLNLFITDITKKSIAATSLFGLLNEVAIFFRESYQRMNVWGAFSKKITLSRINETRWYSKHISVEKIFGEFNDSKNALYISLIEALLKLETDGQFSADVRFKARNLKENLLKFETVITSQIYLRIFEISTPLSKYLQNSGVDFLKCNDLVKHFKNKLISFSRDFERVKSAADNFVTKMNSIMEQKGIDANVEEELPVKRQKKRKKISDESGSDADKEELSVLDKYRINTYNDILDTAVTSVSARFNESNYRIFAYLDPKNFDEVNEETIPINAFEQLSKLLIKINEEATAERLRKELIHFAENWPNLKNGLSSIEAEDNNDEKFPDNFESEDEEEIKDDEVDEVQFNM